MEQAFILQFKKLGAVVFCILYALFAGYFCIDHIFNPVTHIVLILAVPAFVIAIVRPKMGLLLLLCSCVSLDFLKRITILFGHVTQEDVLLILQVAPLLMLGICIGIVVDIIVSRQLIWTKQKVVVAGLVLLGCCIALAAYAVRQKSVFGTLAFAANSVAYVPLIFVMMHLYRTAEEVDRIIGLVLAFFVPVAIYGIYQFFAGMPEFELDYLQTGLTIQYLQLFDVKIRPWSTLNSSHAYSIGLCVITVAALARFLRKNDFPKKVKWFFISLLYLTAIATSLGRTAWLGLALGVVCLFVFRRVATTVALYLVTAVSLVTMVLNAESAIELIHDIESQMVRLTPEQHQAFRLGTFTDRLYSMGNLVQNPEMITWFGRIEDTKDHFKQYDRDTITHDLITQAISYFGIVGSIVLAFICVFILWQCHNIVFSIRDDTARHIAVTLLACLASVFITALFSGSHFQVFPLNVIFWGSLGMILLLRNFTKINHGS